MKTLLLFSVLFCTLAFMGCKSTSQAMVIPEYPRNAQLHTGYYGEKFYSNSTRDKQAKIESCYSNCNAASPVYTTRRAADAPAPLAGAAIKPVVF